MKIKRKNRRFKSYKAYKKWAGITRKADQYGYAGTWALPWGLAGMVGGPGGMYNAFKKSFIHNKKYWKKNYDKPRYKFLNKHYVGSARRQYYGTNPRYRNPYAGRYGSAPPGRGKVGSAPMPRPSPGRSKKPRRFKGGVVDF